MRTSSWLCVVALLAVPVGGCARLKKRLGPFDAPSRFALEVVAASRSASGIGPELVDEKLVESLRRLQLVKHTLRASWDPVKLLADFHGETGPDRQYPLAERPQRQRERATRGLKALLQGRCEGQPMPAAVKGRVQWLTSAGGAKVPEEIELGMADTARILARAEAVIVSCDKGEAVFLIVPGSDGKRRLADVFSLQQEAMGVSPNDPAMK